MIERDFKHLIDEIAILIQFVEGSLEQFGAHHLATDAATLMEDRAQAT